MKVLGQIKVELQETMGDDRTIASSAWTSSLDYQKKQGRTDDDVERVVKMLAELQHSVPFESVVFRFWIKMPISADRQFMTHRIASHSGMSGRYRTMPNEFQQPPEDIYTILDNMGIEHYLWDYNYLCERANDWYNELLIELKVKEKQGEMTNAEFKRCREFFRGVLPQNNMTERVTTMNLRSFANFIKLRLSEHAQPEIRTISQLMLEEVKEKSKCPVAIEWLEKNNWRL
jgi:flavin-dependent thymidylate synthase